VDKLRKYNRPLSHHAEMNEGSLHNLFLENGVNEDRPAPLSTSSGDDLTAASEQYAGALYEYF